MKYLSITVFLLLILCEYSLAQEKDFRNVNWGMSKQEVKKAESSKFLDEFVKDNVIIYNTQIANYDFNLFYKFSSNKLTSASYIGIEEHSNQNVYIDDYNRFKELLTKKYGEPTYDVVKWSNDLFKNDSSQWGLAISIGHVNYITQWKTSKTKVSMVLSGDKYKINFHIIYSSIELGNLERQKSETESLKGL